MPLLEKLLLRCELARYDQPLEELEVSHKLHTIAATALVPAPEPEQGRAFLSGKAGLGKLVSFRSACPCVSLFSVVLKSVPVCSFACAFNLDVPLQTVGSQRPGGWKTPPGFSSGSHIERNVTALVPIQDDPSLLGCQPPI